MSEFMKAVDAFIDDIRGKRASIEALDAHTHAIAKHFPTVSIAESNEALLRFATLFPKIAAVAAGPVSITCGSLVENGADPEIVGPALLQLLPRMIRAVGDYYANCKQRTLASPELIADLRERVKPKNGQPDQRSPAQVVDEHVSKFGWRLMSRRLGSELFDVCPGAVLAYTSDEYFRLGLIAHLSSSKKLRNSARAQPELLQETRSLDKVAGLHDSYLATLLQVLDDETLVVLHVEQRKGFEICINGIADNFQFHTLLAGAIIGAPTDDWVMGEAPSPKAVAECRDANLDPNERGEHVDGAFNLFNWTALRHDGSLPHGQGNEGGMNDWIWNEGSPASILPFEGRRVVLLGPPPYARFWRSGRKFASMTGELTVQRKLPRADVDEWLHCLTRAPRPAGKTID